ncbi:hypothetical protein [Comamonas serinivorans]|uniref:hypothetical protein n=1 Tax=Comamonas serinivorans TaxID=1082851 RepID=UPI001F195F42|nr:hypothetical protein [Comamonas serinivorans]
MTPLSLDWAVGVPVQQVHLLDYLTLEKTQKSPPWVAVRSNEMQAGALIYPHKVLIKGVP